MRKVKFKLLTQVQLEVIETSAVTFGELKEEIRSKLAGKINLDTVTVRDAGVEYKESLKFIEKNTLTEYGSINEALLPAGDCLFYVTPVRTKSGCDYPTNEELENMSYNELRSLGSKLNKEEEAGIALTGKRAEILAEVVDYIDSARARETDECGENEVGSETNPKTLLTQAIELIEAALDKMEDYSKTEEVYADGITFEELHATALKIKLALNS